MRTSAIRLAPAGGVRDVPAMADLDALSRWLARGARSVADALAESAGDGARAEAQRALDVLRERGDLSGAEAARLEAAVADAALTQARWVDERVLAPLARAVRSARGEDAVIARLEALEARLDRLERALARRPGGDAAE